VTRSVLAGAEDLATDCDDARAGHGARDPLVASVLQCHRDVERHVGREHSSLKALLWRVHLQLLVRSLGVVFHDPCVELTLEVLERTELAASDELAAQRVVPALDLAGRRRTGRFGEDVIDPVLSTDLVEEDLGVVATKAASEDLAVEFLSDVKSYFVLFYPFSWDESIDGAPSDSFIRRLVPLLIVRRCARIAS
jgi:hypothetical protein